MLHLTNYRCHELSGTGNEQLAHLLIVFPTTYLLPAVLCSSCYKPECLAADESQTPRGSSAATAALKASAQMFNFNEYTILY